MLTSSRGLGAQCHALHGVLPRPAARRSCEAHPGAGPSVRSNNPLKSGREVVRRRWALVSKAPARSEVERSGGAGRLAAGV